MGLDFFSVPPEVVHIRKDIDRPDGIPPFAAYPGKNHWPTDFMYSTAFSPAMRPLFKAKPMVLPGRIKT